MNLKQNLLQENLFYSTDAEISKTILIVSVHLHHFAYARQVTLIFPKTTVIIIVIGHKIRIFASYSFINQKHHTCSQKFLSSFLRNSPEYIHKRLYLVLEEAKRQLLDTVENGCYPPPPLMKSQ